MKVVGVDMSARPQKTAAVVIEAGGDRPQVTSIVTACDDDTLVDLARDATKVGVDCPLGWPIRFVAAVVAHHRLEGWDHDADTSSLRYRRTDLDVIENLGLHPLSVSTDKLGVVAFRCARLQDRWATEVWEGHEAARDGSGPLVEVYPAAALKCWSGIVGGAALPHQGYRDVGGQSLRGELVARFGEWIDLEPVRAACLLSDHVFDALVSALVTLAAARGHTTPPGPSERDDAILEGWIHLPTVAPSELWSAPPSWR